MSNTTTKKRIKGYDCIVNWFCVGKSDTLTITIDGFDKVLGATTDRKYVERKIGIESLPEEKKP
jgi:hypothetical protein